MGKEIVKEAIGAITKLEVGSSATHISGQTDRYIYLVDRQSTLVTVLWRKSVYKKIDGQKVWKGFSYRKIQLPIGEIRESGYRLESVVAAQNYVPIVGRCSRKNLFAKQPSCYEVACVSCGHTLRLNQRSWQTSHYWRRHA